jgi:hypothetical protein
MDHKAGKGRGEGVALWEAILLDKEVEGAIGAMEIAAIGVGVHGIKVMEKSVETGFGLEDIFTFVAGHLVPAVGEVDKKARTSRGFSFGQRFGNERVVLAVSRVYEKVKTTSYC